MSMGTIYQSIEILSKEKGIEPKVILDAVKDAMLVAARKHFHTTEDLVAEFDERTGAIQITASAKWCRKCWTRTRKFRWTRRAALIRTRRWTPRSVSRSRRRRWGGFRRRPR